MICESGSDAKGRYILFLIPYSIRSLLMMSFKFIPELLPEDDRQYAAATQGYRSAVDCDRNGFSTAAENGAGGGVSHDNGFDNHLPQQRQPFHSSSSSTLGMDKTNPFAALAHQQQQQLKSLNSPITANRQSPLQLRQASPFPHESTNSRRKHFPSNAATATTTTTATATAASGVAQDISRKHRNNISTTNGEDFGSYPRTSSLSSSITKRMHCSQEEKSKRTNLLIKFHLIFQVEDLLAGTCCCAPPRARCGPLASRIISRLVVQRTIIIIIA